VLNGNFGDSIMNKEFREILTYVKEHDTNIIVHTNGSIHNEDYWKDVGNILSNSDIINFALDGLEDTHSIYRINTSYEKVLQNARAVISTQKSQVHWKFIVFDYNEHQVELARQLAKDYGFSTFSSVKTSRDFHRPTSGQFVHRKNLGIENLPKQIICSWDDWGKWYVAPDGLLFRCCWTGGHYYDEGPAGRFYYPPKFEQLFNGLYVPLEQILDYTYWTKLQQFLQGYDRSFKLCQSQCGKIVSSREKIEENLATGETKIFSAGVGYGT